MGLIMLAVIVAAIGFAMQWFASAGTVSDRDVAWLAENEAPTDQEAEVYRSYLRRHRKHRLTGGFFGAFFAAVVGIRLNQSITIGIGEAGTPLADVWFCALAGAIIGALSAESFRLSEPRSDSIAASLADREIEADERVVVAARAIAALTVLIGVFAAVSGRGFDALAISVGAVVLTGVSEQTRSATRNRRRPLLSDEAKVVDMHIRSFATRSVALLQLSAALLAAVWAVSKLPDGDSLELAAVQAIFSFSFLAASLYTLRLARPHPPRRWAPEVATA